MEDFPVIFAAARVLVFFCAAYVAWFLYTSRAPVSRLVSIPMAWTCVVQVSAIGYTWEAGKFWHVLLLWFAALSYFYLALTLFRHREKFRAWLTR